MPVEHSENWYLKKHGTLEVFGPVSFEKIREWADSSQINAQDALSTDQVIWTKAPMVPEMEMDWLIVVGDDIVYGPTTAESLLEFERLGEINARTALINCRTGQSSILAGTPFYQSSFVAVSRHAEAAVAGPAARDGSGIGRGGLGPDSPDRAGHARAGPGTPAAGPTAHGPS